MVVSYSYRFHVVRSAGQKRTRVLERHFCPVSARVRHFVDADIKGLVFHIDKLKNLRNQNNFCTIKTFLANHLNALTLSVIC